MIRLELEMKESNQNMIFYINELTAIIDYIY